MTGEHHEARNAGLWEQITPTTAHLLQWWFGADRAQARGGRAFSEGQQQAIFNTLAAHETEHSQHRVAPPRHRVNLAHEAERVPVMLALLVWQLLNHTDARAAGVNDARFTRHFVALTSGRAARDALLDALWGQPLAGGLGARDFGTAEAVRGADLLIPESRRNEVHAFLCGSALNGSHIGQKTPDEGLIVITDQPLERLAHLARLPRLMAFAHESSEVASEPDHAATAGRRQLRRLVSLHGKPCMEVVFSHGRDLPTDPNGAP